MIPTLPNDLDYPPTLYALMNSLVNYNKEDKTKIKNLAKESRSYIFDFEYPLTDKIDKEKFEVMILNHFMMRRIGYETFTAWQLQLNVKLNNIMPRFNKLFDMLDGWDLFNDGEVTDRTLTDNRTGTVTSGSESNGTSNSNNTSDRRFSDNPQNRLGEVRDGDYITDYNYDTDISNVTNNVSTTNVSQSNDDANTHEVTKRSPSDKIALYKEFSKNCDDIYSLIFKELETLFFQVI